MKEFLPIHKKILIVFVFVLIAFWGIYSYCVQPLKVERQDLWNMIESAKQEINKKSPWANNAQNLDKIETQVREDMKHSSIDLDKVKLSSSLLENRIKQEQLIAEFSDLKKSSINARYRQEYREFLVFLKEKNLGKPNPEFFKMNVESLDAQDEQVAAWQLILKLWTAEFAINNISEAGLKVVQFAGQSQIDDRKKTTFYYIEEIKNESLVKNPFLAISSISFKIQGTALQFQKLLMLGMQKNNFLPISFLEMKLKPEDSRISEIWEATIEFSGFLRLTTDNEKWSMLNTFSQEEK